METVVNFMIKLPVDLSNVPPYIIKVRRLILNNLDYRQSLFPLRVVEENEQASERKIVCHGRVES